MEGLKSVQNIVAGKGSFPSLQNVLIEAVGKEVRLTTTDLDISITCVCECEVQESGSTTLPVKSGRPLAFSEPSWHFTQLRSRIGWMRRG